MTTMVCFTAAGADYCMPVESTRSVRTTSGMIRLPSPAPGIAGILPGAPALTVSSALGTGGSQILIVETDQAVFGLLVDQVTGLQQITDADVSPSPAGQHRPFIAGTIENRGRTVLITDPNVLAGQL